MAWAEPRWSAAWWLPKPKSITPHTKFEAQVYVLTKEEGGRHTQFFTGYRPQFYFRTTDVTGSLNLPEGVDMVMPGDNVSITAELIQPIAMEEGLRFAIREGGRTVASGVGFQILPHKGKDTMRQSAKRDKIRIRLKAYDHKVLDQSAERIVQTARRSGARISGPVPLFPPN